MPLITRREAAKLLAIDKANKYNLHTNEWETNFIISLMSQIVDKKKDSLTDKQIQKLQDIYHKFDADGIFEDKPEWEDFTEDERIMHCG